jgi:hypothetical protein
MTRRRHVLGPLLGGSAKQLMRIVGIMSSIGADGQKLYVSGLRDEEMTKPGIFRVDAATGSVEELDRRLLHGSAFVSGDTLVIIGGGMVEPGKTQHGQLVLSRLRAKERASRSSLASPTSRRCTPRR